MKKLKIIFISIVVLLTMIFGIYFFDNYNYYKPGENGSFQLGVGEEFSIKLYENPSTGYSNCWLNESSSVCCVKTTEKYEADWNPIKYEGSGGVLLITFKAIKRGIDTLKIASCPTYIEGKTCKDYNEKNAPIDNKFYITVE